MKKIKNIAYYCGKVVEGVSTQVDGIGPEGLGKVNLDLIEQLLDELVEDLKANPGKWRDLPERLKCKFDPLKFALGNLRQYFSTPRPSREAQLTADIFAEWLFFKVPKFVDDYQGADSE